MNEKVYIHEFIDIRGHHRANYMQHMTANWSPLAQETRHQLCYGVWAVLGSTGAWPQTVNMWEEDGWDGLADSFGGEAVGAGAQDPALERWWAKASEFRRGGFDRIIVPAPWTPTIEQLCAGRRARRRVRPRTRQGPARRGVASCWNERATRPRRPRSEHGWQLAGAFTTAMVDDDEALLLWAIPTWARWGHAETAHQVDDRLVAWRDGVRDIVTTWQRVLLVDAPLSPMRTGRQPSRDDRTDWAD